MTARIVILAAGKGTRMKSDVPKVLQVLNGRPILSRLADAVLSAGVDPHPVVVIGPAPHRARSGAGNDSAAIREILGENFVYAVQDEQLGTGHAVQCAEEILKGKADAVIVLNGDHPFIKAETIRKLKELYETGGGVLTMMTVKAPDFGDWRAALYDFGRVLRDAEGRIRSIVEAKDASPGQLDVMEVNPALYCFRADWLWENLKSLTPENAQKEYYLGDLVKKAIDAGETITSMEIDPAEAIGVNTPEHLELARKLEEEN